MVQKKKKRVPFCSFICNLELCFLSVSLFSLSDVGAFLISALVLFHKVLKRLVLTHSAFQKCGLWVCVSRQCPHRRE